MEKINYTVQSSDSLTGAWTSQLSNWTRDPSSEYPLARKVASKIGYGLLFLVGMIETLGKPILGLLCAGVSLVIPGDDGKRFYNMTVAPLFAGTVFSGVSTAMTIRNFFYDKEPGVYTTEPIPVTMVRHDTGEEIRVEGTAYHYEEDFFGDFVYASHYGTTECLTAKLRNKFCEVKDVVLSD